ncbi:MAG TPA: hypothetical protein VGH40_04810 [Roseiarcus sp.]
MARYEVRLYKPRDHNPNKSELVDRVAFEAVDGSDALSKAPDVQIPEWDDSDWAVLFSEDGRTLWHLRRQR